MVDKNRASTEAAAASTVTTSEQPVAADTTPSHDDLVKAAIALLQSEGYLVRQATAAQRVTAVKAEPSAVKAYFDSTGLTRKQIADAVGVGISVIATVQNENGDRWSLVRFEAAKILIDAYKTALAALIAPTPDPLAAAAASLEATDPAAAAELAKA